MKRTTKPGFREIADHLRSQILGGDLRVGDEVPSQRAIAAEYGVSRPTATRALELLGHEGLVQSVQGSGTYVAPAQHHKRASERYETARASGRIYGDGERAEIVAAELVEKPPPSVVESLELPSGVAAIRRRRIIWPAEGEPIEASTSWFDATLLGRAPRLLSRERIRGGTLAYVESSSGRQAAYALDRICARPAGADDARDLRLTRSAVPVLVVEHTAYDGDGRPLEHVEAVYPPGSWTREQRYDIR